MKRPLEKTTYKVTLGPKEDGTIGIQEMIVEKYPYKGFDEHVIEENLKRENDVANRFGNFKIVSDEEFEAIK